MTILPVSHANRGRYRFTVMGEAVPKQSFRYRAGRPYQSARVRYWEDLVGWTAKEAMQGAAPLEGHLELNLVFFRKTRRRADWDNLCKAICDALNGIVWHDDSQIQQATVVIRRVENEPKVEVTVRRIE